MKKKQRSSAKGWADLRIKEERVNMARRQLDIKTRLERQEKKILKLSEELEAAKGRNELSLIERRKTNMRSSFRSRKKRTRRSYSKHIRRAGAAWTRCWNS